MHRCSSSAPHGVSVKVRGGIKLRPVRCFHPHDSRGKPSCNACIGDNRPFSSTSDHAISVSCVAETLKLACKLTPQASPKTRYFGDCIKSGPHPTPAVYRALSGAVL